MAVSMRSMLTNAVWFFAWVVLHYWFAIQMYQYFGLNPQQQIASFVENFLPANASAPLVNGFAGIVDHVQQYKKHFHFHIALSVPWGAFFAFLLIPYFRNNFIELHKVIGNTTAVLTVPVLLQVFYTLTIKGMVPFGPAVVFGNSLSLVLLAVFVPLGVYYAKNGQILKHRSMMIMAAAGAFINPVMRFFWVILSKSEVGGPYVSFEQYLDATAKYAELISIVLCVTVGVYYAFGPGSTKVTLPRGYNKQRTE